MIFDAVGTKFGDAAKSGDFGGGTYSINHSTNDSYTTNVEHSSDVYMLFGIDGARWETRALQAYLSMANN
jgi:hypothetical protein